MLVVSFLVVRTCTRTCVRFCASIMRSLVHRVLGLSTGNVNSGSPEFQACTEVLIFQHWDSPEPEIMLLTKRKRRTGYESETGANEKKCSVRFLLTRLTFFLLSTELSNLSFQYLAIFKDVWLRERCPYCQMSLH